MLALADELRDRFDIVLACPAGAGNDVLLARAAALGLGVKRLDLAGEGDTRWLARHGPDLLHIHAGVGWEGHGLAVAGRDAGVARLVRTEHLPDVITDPQQREAHTAGLALVDAVICVSSGAAASFEQTGIPGFRPTVIRNGVPPARPSRGPQATRALVGLTPERRVLLTTARLTPQKGLATLLDAMPAVLDRHPEAVLLLAGDGPLETALRTQIDRLGLAGAVRLLGRRSDVPDLMAASDLFVLPSLFEGLPLAVLEAMAAGLPVVATAVGGTDEAVVDEVTGRLVRPGDAAALATAITACLSDPAMASAFGAAARARFRTVFTARRMANETAALYSSLGVEPQETRRSTMSEGPPARTRIGFIGAGGIAHRHLGVLEGFEDVEIAAFADVDLQRARGAAERFGARAYADGEAMLAAETLDALYICVPPFAHGAPERAALRHRLPFFVEKPLALDLAVAEEIASAVAAAGLVTGVGYHWRYLDTVDEARSLLADKPARLLSGYWLDSTPPPVWWWSEAQSGGQLTEQTTHIVDLARYLVGDVVQVFGLGGHTQRGDFPGLDVATASTASLRFASGAIGNIGSTCLLRWNHRVGLHIFGDGLALEMTDHDIMVDVGRGRPVRHAEGDPVWREDRDFIDAVRGGEKPHPLPLSRGPGHLAHHRRHPALDGERPGRRPARRSGRAAPAGARPCLSIAASVRWGWSAPGRPISSTMRRGRPARARCASRRSIRAFRPVPSSPS